MRHDRSCTKAPSQDELIARAQTEPAIAASLARQRLASSELESALHFFQLAAGAGDSDALSHALALRQRLHGRLNTAIWLEQQLRDGSLLADAVSQAKRAELGLWGHDKPQVAAVVASAGCQLTLQPVASQQQGGQPTGHGKHLLQARPSQPGRQRSCQQQADHRA